MVLTNEDIEAVKDDDESEVGEGEPCSIWLELALEDESVTVYTLGIERLVELDVGYADRAPCEERGDSGQVLEPIEDYGWATRAA